MRDRGIIYAGLALLLIAATFPGWRNFSSGATAKGPDVARPTTGKQCVAAVDFMRNSHMDLLVSWREDVVRRGARDFTAADGSRYRMSLTSTCLGQCHGGKEEFCERCHHYAAVSLSCWDCHVDSKVKSQTARLGPDRVGGGAQ